MRRLFALITAAALALTLAACSGGGTSPTPASTPTPTPAPAAENPTPAPAPEPILAAGDFGFSTLDYSQKLTSTDFVLEKSDFGGAPALKIAPQGGKVPFIAFSFDGLLAEGDFSKAASFAVKIGLKSTDGNFWALSGNIYTYTGSDLKETKSPAVGITTENGNPKVFTAPVSGLTPGAKNYAVFVPSQDDGSTYTGKNELYILGVGFKDAAGEWLNADSGASAAFPEGYGEFNEVKFETVDLVPFIKDWKGDLGEGALSQGAANGFKYDVTDGKTLTPEQVSKALRMVVEYEQIDMPATDVPAGNITFVAQLDSQGWQWNEYKNDGASGDFLDFSQPGKLVFFFPAEIAESTQGALSFANWGSELNVTKWYLEYAAG